VVRLPLLNLQFPLADISHVDDQIIELGLQQETGLLSLIDQILSILPDAAADSEKLQSARFRGEIQSRREELRSRGQIKPVVQSVLSLCQDYFRRVKVHRLERELEYVDMIEVLRGAISKLAGETTTFNAQLLMSSDRFDKLTETDDIREIKNQIATEVQGLRQAVEEKHKQDELNLSFLSHRVEMLQLKLHRAQDEAAIDSLTRIANRGTFDRTVARWIEEHSGKDTTFVLALLDIDDFKRINDIHGHPVGDRVLVGASQLLSDSIRPTDFVARYGGEEFAILLDGIRLAPAETRMSQLIEMIAAYHFNYESGALQFTFSCGLAEYGPADTVDSLIQRADEGLYEAKRKGKNRVVARRRSILKSMFGSL
jgi:diguanylate cyclase